MSAGKDPVAVVVDRDFIYRPSYGAGVDSALLRMAVPTSRRLVEERVIRVEPCLEHRRLQRPTGCEPPPPNVAPL